MRGHYRFTKRQLALSERHQNRERDVPVYSSTEIANVVSVGRAHFGTLLPYLILAAAGWRRTDGWRRHGPRRRGRMLEAGRFDGNRRLLDAAEDEAFQVIGLGHADDDWMIASLHPLLDHRHRRVAVDRRQVNHLREHLLVDVVRAAARDEIPTWIEQAHRAEIDLLVSRHRVRD